MFNYENKNLIKSFINEPFPLHFSIKSFRKKINKYKTKTKISPPWGMTLIMGWMILPLHWFTLNLALLDSIHIWIQFGYYFLSSKTVKRWTIYFLFVNVESIWNVRLGFFFFFKKRALKRTCMYLPNNGLFWTTKKS